MNETHEPRVEWPRAIWAGERMPDEISGYHVFSEHATIARFDGDIECEREFHCYVDADIFDSEQRYHEHQRAAIATERDALRTEVERLENSLALADHLWTAKQARLTRMDLRLEAARAALTEIAAISGGPIRRIALGALDKMETD